MSRRSSRASSSVSLFPFLAVLVCAMGALILLLLVTTRRIRSEQAAQFLTAAIQEAPLVEVAPTVATQTEPDDLRRSDQVAETRLDSRSGPAEQDLASAFAQAAEEQAARAWAERRAEIAAAQQESLALRQTWQQRVAQLQDEYQRREAELKLLQGKLDAEAQSIEAARDAVRAAADQLAEVTNQREAALRQEQELRNEYKRLETQLQQAAAAMEASQAQQRDSAQAGSKYAVTVFDYRTGTARRPILIECTAAGFRFLPENVSVTASDLEGFPTHFNPLLAGAFELMNYWIEWNRRQTEPDSAGTPYVLLLVRPSGASNYYAARMCLGELGSTFGYELIDESIELKLPAVDPEARRRLQTSVQNVLKQRERQFALRQGESRNGTSHQGRQLGVASSSATAGGTLETRSGGNSSEAGDSSRRAAPLKIDGRILGGSIESEQPDVQGQLPVPETVAEVLLDDTRANAIPVQGARRTVSTTQAPAAQLPHQTGHPGLQSTPDQSETDHRAVSSTAGDPLDKPSSAIAPLRLTEADLKRDRSEPSRRSNDPPPTQRRWGVIAPGNGVALTKQVTIRVERDRIIIDRQHAIAAGTMASWNDVANQVVNAILQQRNSWGPPPPRFYWMPSVHFEVDAGGSGLYEHLDGFLHSGGIKTSSEFVNVQVENRPGDAQAAPPVRLGRGEPR